MDNAGHSFKKILLIIELIGLLFFVALFVKRSGNNKIIELNLKDMVSECERLTFDGTSWSIPYEDGDDYINGTYMLNGPYVSLKRGTYTIVVDYESTEINKAVLEVDEGVIDTTDYFLLSNNKNEVRYDFALKTDVKGFRFSLKEFYGGAFQLNKLTIIQNAHDIRTGAFIWIVLCMLLNMCFFIKKVQNNMKTILFIAIIAFLASLPLLPQGIMTGDDIRFHLVRIEAIVDGLKSGAFPVRMYPIYNDGYGYPVAVFYGDVLLYIPALLRIVGFTTLQSYKIYIVLMNILTATISLVCGKKMFKKELTAYIFSMAFTLSTYRLLCLYARASVGEFSATCFYPIIILAIWRIYTQDPEEKSYNKNSIILAIGMAGIIFNHVLSTEMMVITLALLALCLYKKTFKKQTILVFIKAVGIFVCLGASFIIPFFEYYISLPLMIKSTIKSDYIQDSGAYISDYFAFFKSITGGNYFGRRGLQTPGLLLMVGLFIGIALIIYKKADRAILVTTVGSITCLFMASNICPWNRIYEIPILGPILVTVQFPYRYIGIAICFMTVLLGLVIEKIVELNLLDKRIYIYTTIATLIMSFFFLSQYQDERYITGIYKSYDTSDLYVLSRNGQFGMYMLIAGQYLLDDTNLTTEVFDYGVYGQNIQALLLSEEGIKMEVYVNAGKDATLEVPRFAYPHYVAKDRNGNEIKTVKGFNNKVTLQFTQEYTGEVYIDFVEPWYWRMAELITLMSVLFVLYRYFGEWYRDRRREI